MAFALNVVVFSVAFRLAVVEDAWKDLWLAAFLTVLGWKALLTVGGYLISHDLKSAVYGSFALVLGLMPWLYLQVQASPSRRVGGCSVVDERYRWMQVLQQHD